MVGADPPVLLHVIAVERLTTANPPDNCGIVTDCCGLVKGCRGVDSDARREEDTLRVSEFAGGIWGRAGGCA